ncbi:putative GMP synthase [Daphnia magna]|uniref:Putative GMP synthase n=1 Tax=Daphnia magna TaxID=35525 RepID=A0A164LT12_9CRUS|nr:putative GMP synthase [Daphnia magna]
MATSRADAIKTHPHDSEMVRQLRLHGRVVEHLKDFHKDELRALGRELGLPAELLERHPYPGPGLSIRIICAEEPFMEADFGESQVLIRLIVDYASMAARNMPCSPIEIGTSEEERLLLEELSSHKPVCCHATANSHCRCSDCRTYSYCVALISEWLRWKQIDCNQQTIVFMFKIGIQLSEVNKIQAFKSKNCTDLKITSDKFVTFLPCSVFQRIFRQKINVVILHCYENSTNLLGKTGSKICRTMNHPEYICSMECLTRIW